MNLENKILCKYNLTTERFRKLLYSPEVFFKVEIPKKNKKLRKLYVPTSELLEIQRYVLCYLKNNIKIKEKFFEKQHAYTNNKSNISYATGHVGKKYIIKFDIKDYFESITFSRVLGSLRKNLPHNEKENALLIAQLACYRVQNGNIAHHKSLAQGSALSPFLSNMISTSIDSFFLQYLSKSLGVSVDYSRFSDDITISTDSRADFDKIKLAEEEIKEKIGNRGFVINDEKTQFIVSGRKVVGGLVINEKKNLRKEYIDKIRLNLFYAKKRGNIENAANLYLMQNKISYSTAHAVEYFELSIRSKISYLANVKGNNDSVVKKYKRQYNSIPKFQHKFDIRENLEKSIFPITFETENIDSIDSFNGTCFYLKNVGIISCCHNFMALNDKVLNNKTCYKDIKLIGFTHDRLEEYRFEIPIRISELAPKVLIDCIENGTIIYDTNRDIFVIKEDFFSEEELILIKKHFVPIDKSDIPLSDLDEKSELLVAGYVDYSNCDKLGCLKTSYKKQSGESFRHELTDVMGAGASGGPVLDQFGKVLGIYVKGNSETPYPVLFTELLREL